MGGCRRSCDRIMKTGCDYGTRLLERAAADLNAAAASRPAPTSTSNSLARTSAGQGPYHRSTLYNNLCYKPPAVAVIRDYAYTTQECERRARLDSAAGRRQAGCDPSLLSMLERGLRNTARLARKLMQVYNLPATLVPFFVKYRIRKPGSLAQELTWSGYPGFAHLRKGGRKSTQLNFC